MSIGVKSGCVVPQKRRGHRLTTPTGVRCSEDARAAGGGLGSRKIGADTVKARTGDGVATACAWASVPRQPAKRVGWECLGGVALGSSLAHVSHGVGVRQNRSHLHGDDFVRVLLILRRAGATGGV